MSQKRIITRLVITYDYTDDYDGGCAVLALPIKLLEYNKCMHHQCSQVGDLVISQVTHIVIRYRKQTNRNNNCNGK